jgi:NAD(P)-dependent dehydrogenase (short-subunit alcohol dehydrogenase family)
MGKRQRHIGARQGAKVFGTELNPTGVAETITITREQRSEREVACADMTNGDHVKVWVDGCIRRLGQIEVRVTDIGGGVPGNPVFFSEKDRGRYMDLNPKIAFLSANKCYREWRASMKTPGTERRVRECFERCTCESSGGGGVMVAHAAAKAALVPFTRATAIGYMRNNAPANTDIVGMTNTQIIERLTAQFDSYRHETMRAKRQALVLVGYGRYLGCCQCHCTHGSR